MDGLFRKPDDVTKVMYKDGDTEDIINVILHADKYAARDTVEVAKKFERQNFKKQCRSIYDFVRKNIRYRADQNGHERIKSPSVVWKDKYADCKSMSILIGSILKNLGIKYAYRFAKYKSYGDFTHVYIVAEKSGRQIIIDATLDQFNYEVPHRGKTDKWMSKISYVHGAGLGKSKIGQAAPKRYYALNTYTSGEFKLMLHDERLEILQSYYGDQTGIIQLGRNMINRSLTMGLHSGAGLTSFSGQSIPKELQYLSKIIRDSQRRINPAGAIFSSQRREAISGKFDDYLVKPGEYDCKRYAADQFAQTKNIGTLVVAKKECLEFQLLENLFNEKLGDTGHQVLYQWMTKAQSRENATVAVKYDRHLLAMQTLAALSKLDLDLIQEAAHNGVMRMNQKKGIAPLEPIPTINVLRQAGKSNSIGFDPATFTAIATAIIGALAATVDVITQLKQPGTSYYASAQQLAGAGYGTEQFGPDKDGGDFLYEATGGAIDTQSALPLIGVAVGAYLLLSNN